jgi:hypothetical protein
MTMLTQTGIHAMTGYPMCIPRSDPKVADDPLCPSKNRPVLDPTQLLVSPHALVSIFGDD